MCGKLLVFCAALLGLCLGGPGAVGAEDDAPRKSPSVQLAELLQKYNDSLEAQDYDAAQGKIDNIAALDPSLGLIKLVQALQSELDTLRQPDPGDDEPKPEGPSRGQQRRQLSGGKSSVTEITPLPNRPGSVVGLWGEDQPESGITDGVATQPDEIVVVYRPHHPQASKLRFELYFLRQGNEQQTESLTPVARQKPGRVTWRVEPGRYRLKV